MSDKDDKGKQDATDDAAKKAADGSDIDPTVAELIKDPKAVEALLKAKREANDEAKKLRLKQEAADKAQKAKDDAALAEQGKFKELAEKHKAEAETAVQKLTRKQIDFELKLIAVQSGAIDPADVLALCNREGVKLAEDGESVIGAKEAVEALKKSKPHLFKDEGGAGGGEFGRDRKPPLKAANDGKGMTAEQKIAWGLEHPEKN